MAPHGEDWGVDIVATLNQLPGGNRVRMLVECKALPRPSQFPHVGLTRTFSPAENRTTTDVPVLAAPFISERMAELCDQHGWSWYDLAGNCRLNVPGAFYIERSGQKRTVPAPKPKANLGTSDAAQVIRTLLAPVNGGTRWTLRTLQDLCKPGVSIGLVHKVVSFLRDEAFLTDQEKGGFRVTDPLGLLTAWNRAYRFDRHERLSYFTLLKGTKLQQTLAQLDSVTGGHAVYASFSAAEHQAAYVRQPKTWLYVDATYLENVCDALSAEPVESGENLVILIPEDSGVFSFQDGGQMGQARLPCTNLVQTYVDLQHSGGRGQEASMALLEQQLKPDWQRRGLA